MPTWLALLTLCLILAVLSAGCGDDKKKVDDAAAAKEWQQKSPPPAYIDRMKGMSGPPKMHGGPPAAGGNPAAPVPPK